MTASTLIPRAIAAATEHDPYPYYADLVARAPLARDEVTGLWIAAGDQFVREVLVSDLVGVRPAAEPIPRAIVGSPAGELFGRLIRMNDGAYHTEVRPAVVALISQVGLGVRCREWAEELASEPQGHQELARYAFALPAHVLGDALGIDREHLPAVAAEVGDLVAGWAPGASPAALAAGADAARALRSRFAELAVGDGALASVAAAWPQAVDALVANGIGLLTQAYDATAGLIGNALLLLARRPDLRSRVGLEPAAIEKLIRETARWDPAIQNTRRFVLRDGELAGQRVRTGEVVLVLLAAAGRDPARYERPHDFDLERPVVEQAAFGRGRHCCPGSSLAIRIAAAGVEALLRAGKAPAAWPGAMRYRPSINARIPLWEPGEERA
jgi:cytochrome P450